jgi:hypothetical protein
VSSEPDKPDQIAGAAPHQPPPAPAPDNLALQLFRLIFSSQAGCILSSFLRGGVARPSMDVRQGPPRPRCVCVLVWSVSVSESVPGGVCVHGVIRMCVYVRARACVCPLRVVSCHLRPSTLLLLLLSLPRGAKVGKTSLPIPIPIPSPSHPMDTMWPGLVDDSGDTAVCPNHI